MKKDKNGVEYVNINEEPIKEENKKNNQTYENSMPQE